MSGAVFVKCGPPSALAMFEAEAEGLRELANVGAIRVPEVYEVSTRNGEAFIEMERLRLGSATRDIESRFGEQLALLHRHTNAKHGWHRDNTIGPIPQVNTRSADWVAFFREHRLLYQLDLADTRGYGGELQVQGRQLADRLDTLFGAYVPEASLCHGDLWGGNWGACDGEPVIFDPAVYYGDRESDIAMTLLFGGFGDAFYDAYYAAWPMAEGSEDRLRLYQLYHVLNHLNLFGSGYLQQALSLLARLCR